MLEDPQKFFDINFFQFFEKQTPKLAFWDLANMKRNIVRKFEQSQKLAFLDMKNINRK